MAKTRIDWDAERERYVTGTESLGDIAKRLGVATKSVKRHAASPGCTQTWTEQRVAFRLARDGAAREEIATTQAELQAAIAVGRLQISERHIKCILALDPSTMKLREHIELAKLGVDQKIQIGTDKPIEVDLGVSDAERSALRRILETAGGRPAQDSAD